MAEARATYRFEQDLSLQVFKRLWQTTLSEWVQKFKSAPREAIFFAILKRLRSKALTDHEKKYWQDLIKGYIESNTKNSEELLLVALDYYSKITPPIYFRENSDMEQKNYKKAEELFTQVRQYYSSTIPSEENDKNKYAIALCLLAEMRGWAGDEQAYNSLLNRARKELNSPYAMFKLGFIEQAANLGSPEALDVLADGRKQEKKFAESVNFASKAVECGSGISLMILANLHLEGKEGCVEKNVAKAAIYTRFAVFDPRCEINVVFEKSLSALVRKIFYPKKMPLLDPFVQYQCAMLNKSKENLSELYLKNSVQFFQLMEWSGENWSDLHELFNKRLQKKLKKELKIVIEFLQFMPGPLINIIFDYAMPQGFLEKVVIPVAEGVNKEKKEIAHVEQKSIEKHEFKAARDRELAAVQERMHKQAEERANLKRYQEEALDYKLNFLWAKSLPPEELRKAKSFPAKNLEKASLKPLRFP